MFTCKELTELVTDYFEGHLPFGERLRFQLHVGMCGPCRRYLRQMRLTVDTLGCMPSEPIPEAAREELLKRFQDWQE